MANPDDTTEILEGLLKQLDKIQAATGTSPTEFALANAMAVLVSVLLHERRATQPQSIV